MLTAETEGGQLKCHPYWAGREFGPYRLKALSEKRVALEPNTHRNSTTRRDSDGRLRASTTTGSASPNPATPSAEVPHVVVRKFTLAHTAQPFTPLREITQLHYSSWPDFGAPAQPSHLLALVEQCNAISRAALPPPLASKTKYEEPDATSTSRPVLVHCSAGCGRTGTFCTVDSVIDMLKRQRGEARSGVTPMEINTDEGDYLGKTHHKPNKSVQDDWIFDQDIDLVEKTVEDFRLQRISMVQSLRQYVLCYETALEWLAQQHAPNRGHERGRSESIMARKNS